MKTLILFLTLSQPVHASIKEIPILHFEPGSYSNSKTPTKASLDLNRGVILAEKVFNWVANRCGYSTKIQSFNFREEDSIELANLVQSKVNLMKPWLIMGSRQSHHYLIQVNSAPDIPSFSPLASNEKVFSLPLIHRTYAKTPTQLAKALVRRLKAKAKIKNATYISIVKSICPECHNHADEFDRFATLSGLKKIGNIEVVDQTADLNPVISELQLKKPTYVLLPNYWDLSYYVIDSISQKSNSKEIFASTTFLAFDGWGDSNYGIFTNVKIPQHFKAIIARSLPQAEVLLKASPTCQGMSECRTNPPLHAAGAIYVIALERLGKVFCERRPSSFIDFLDLFKSMNPYFYDSIKNIHIYSIQNGKFVYVEPQPI